MSVGDLCWAKEACLCPGIWKNFVTSIYLIYGELMLMAPYVTSIDELGRNYLNVQNYRARNVVEPTH